MAIARPICAFDTRNYLANLLASRTLCVPEFLAPALARPPRRALSSSRHCQHSDAPQSQQRRPAGPSSKFSRVQLPEPPLRNDIEAWTAAIDVLLPRHLRRQPELAVDTIHHVATTDLARVLLEAQKFSHDILGHICLVEKRWEAAIWVIKQLLETGPPAVDKTVELGASGSGIWPPMNSKSLLDLTYSPIVASKTGPPREPQHSLWDLTLPPNSINPEKVFFKRALGQVWRSLGTLILEAAEDGDSQDKGIMPHVLEILALMHHDGWIPDSVYRDDPVRYDLALHQPPTLHLLSSSIMRALSDAAMRAREATTKQPQDKLNASYLFGREIPGSRYQVHVSGIRPELWLELVLWSSLHGGWVLDGATILERMLSSPAGSRWRPISWKQLFKDELEEDNASSKGWRLFGRRQNDGAKADASARVQKTISCETIAAYVDGLINLVRVGVGSRGTAPEEIVRHITNLKHFLDRDSYSLGSATWDSVAVRILESGGVIPEKRPDLLMDIAQLAPEFGTEIASHNSLSHSTADGAEIPYYYEPTAVSISLLHRTMRSFIENGDIMGAVKTLNTLVQHTDNNKQKSLLQFFESLKLTQRRANQPFTSWIPPIDYPAFNAQLPVPLLVKLLDLATQTRSFHLGRWLLLSEDLDGPAITRDMYDDANMAAAIVRFGTLANENDLVMKVMKKTGFWSGTQQAHRVPNSLLTALMASQVQLHRWDSVRRMQDFVLQNPGYRPKPELLAIFAAELLRVANGKGGTTKGQRAEAFSAFTDLLFAWEGLLLTRMGNELYTVLTMLSSVDTQFRKVCSQFLENSGRYKVAISTSNFNIILSGVLDAYGSIRGRALVDLWCHRQPGAYAPYQAPGGLPTMSHLRRAKAKDYEERPEDIEFTQASGATVVMQGRVLPDRHTIRGIIRKIQQDVDKQRQSEKNLEGSKRAQIRETLRWAAEKLHYLGLDDEDVARELGDVGEIAELQDPDSVEATDAPMMAQP
ncbi:hypothetical protein M011DRAFT_26345 [Sporormia fimetaria CBS 119925]|uniref:Uncharacterized protein n=1 Tax=Sporormia fimetaria CBS 119925 TaxID=1340428 RepID=A0A6A6VFV0_9PLEO|nr:hypothetical protein M011DRAFT_26345 [Sporormia fimetaria CBS 119925]